MIKNNRFFIDLTKISNKNLHFTKQTQYIYELYVENATMLLYNH